MNVFGFDRASRRLDFFYYLELVREISWYSVRKGEKEERERKGEGTDKGEEAKGMKARKD